MMQRSGPPFRLLVLDNRANLFNDRELLLAALHGPWQVEFSSSSQDALEKISLQPFHIFLTDLNVPDGNIVRLLETVKKRAPFCIRMVMAQQVDRDTSLKLAGIAHQILARPFDAATLRASLEHLMNLRSLLDRPELISLINNLKTIPSLPSLYLEILQELRSPSASSESVGAIIARDPAMTARVLQLVNSAFFGVRQAITTPGQATAFLGMETIRDLVFTIQVFSQFSQNTFERLGLKSLWNHSINTGFFARMIARTEGAGKIVADGAFVAGLLHDLGKLVLAENMPTQYAEVHRVAAERRIPLIEAEQMVFGATHERVGAYLMSIWGLPEAVAEAVALHHYPNGFEFTSPVTVTALHAANVIDHRFNRYAWSPQDPEYDTAFLTSIGMDTHLPVWERTCQARLGL